MGYRQGYMWDICGYMHGYRQGYRCDIGGYMQGLTTIITRIRNNNKYR